MELQDRSQEALYQIMLARYYSSSLGRFMAVDPGNDTALGDPQSWNKYAYVRNNPINANDPTGQLADYLIDIPMAAVSVYQAVQNPTVGNIVGAVLDVAAAAIPIVPAVGGRLIDAAQAGGRAVDAAQAAGRVDNAADAGRSTEVVVDAARHPESAAHIQDAQAAGQPSTLTIDRPGAPARREDALGNTPAQPGMDRDEYPPAMFQEGGQGASVRPVTPSDNRGAGACIGNQCRGLPDGTKVEVKVTEAKK